MADEEERSSNEGGKPKGKSRLLLIVLIVNVLAVVGVGAFLFLGKGGESEEEASDEEAGDEGEGGEDGEGEGEGEDGEGHGKRASKKGKAVAFGPMVEFMPILANLNDPTAGRYVKVTLRAEVADEEAKLLVEAGMVPIRDRLLTQFSGMTVADTLGTDNRETIVREVKALMNRVLGRDIVKNVYFTEFVVQ